MKAKYQGHRILDASSSSLENWDPPDPTDFSVMIDFYACPEGENTADAFTAHVCSPSWFFQSRKEKVVSGENTIFMHRFDGVELVNFLKERCMATEGDTWEAIAAQLTRLGRWEFDYRL
ncbi:conserved hypothetical protein [Mesorhizobium prunaredense]|uniref:Immunity protein 8 n=1 Tax=Mesorhizobium prunaredense TaxID=1631249 RepID=A0A1R3V2U1_9HYPH|nr:Imm8 family immunity protein [Mesorhizobium prunaredense]SIT54243.1 conserved hypothetical protein [Mesorhizobium prunaredense]